MGKKYLECYYYFSSLGLRKLFNCDYNQYENLFYKFDNNGFHVYKLGKYVIFIPILEK